ncbi:MAG: hypothetical protein N3E49_07215 [Bacteroidia bacterium]|nr:hypothetical protein [Bacteroidia bacterium]
MHLPKWAVGIGSLLIVAGGYGLYALHRENQSLYQEVERVSHLIQERPVELATFMASYERFLTKLHQAGAAENWPLAAFYHEELEETAEQLERLAILDDGIPVSAMMRPNLIEPLEAVERAIQAKDAASFHKALQEVVVRCNGCHVAAGKPYIRFSIPTTDQPPRQLFSKKADI